VRHWDGILHHRCFSASFGDHYAIDFYSLVDVHGALSKGGVVARGGRKNVIEDFEFTVALENDGLTARSRTFAAGIRPASHLSRILI